MTDLSYRQQKIQERRKQTSFRDFVMEICSRFPVNVYKQQGCMSRFPPSSRCGDIYPMEEFLDSFRDGVGAMSYDHTQSFFEQLTRFFVAAPKMALLKYGKNENVRYADTVYGANNAYMTFSVGNDADNIVYSCMVFEKCQDVVSSFMVTTQNQYIYFSTMITQSFQVFYSRHIHNSSDIRFSSNLIGCKDCLFCSGLENQQYCIYNEQYTKEVYVQKKQTLLKTKHEFPKWYLDVDTVGLNRVSEDVSGSAIIFSNDIENGHMVARIEHGRNIIGSDGSPYSYNQYDLFDAAEVNDVYAWMGVGQHSEHVYCGANCARGSHIFYSYFMDGCSYCLGCTGLTNKSYCIFNKQYTKEERHGHVYKIFETMESEGVLGNFFSPSMNPFYFNDTAAYLIDNSFTKEEVTAKGYLRRDEQVKVDIPEGATLVKTSELGEYEGWRVGTSDDSSVRYIDPSILDKVIQDEDGNIYRIVKMEYDFLMKYGLPLPRLHRLERLKIHFTIT